MVRAGFATVALLAGCFSKPADLTGGGVDAAPGDTMIDTGTPTSCSEHAFMTFTELPEFSQDGHSEPSITGDMMEMFFTHEIAGPRYEIFHATWTAKLGKFASFTKLDLGPGFTMALADSPDPSITADGSILVFRYESGMGVKAHITERTNGTWSTPQVIAGLSDELVSSLDISWDGLTLYFYSSGMLQYASRSSLTEDFVIRGTIGGDFRFPTVSADGLELYYYDNGHIQRRTRTLVTDSFTGPRLELDVAFDPDLSFDGTTLFVSKSNLRGILKATRPCD